jgi:hypothetical protein
MRRIYVVLLGTVLALLICAAAATLGSIWAQILNGGRTVRIRDMLASVALIAFPFLVAYLVKFERRVRVDGRAQHAALARLHPGAVIFTTQAVPETARGLDGLRALAAGAGPRVKADHRPLTVTVNQYGLSVWEGSHKPRPLAMILAHDIGQISYAETPVVAGIGRQRKLPSLGVWSTSGSRLVLPVIVVQPRMMKPSADDVRAVVGEVGRALRLAPVETRSN